MATKANVGEFYRSDLAHAVNTLGAALRSLHRMGLGSTSAVILMGASYHGLQQELEEARKREREAK